MEPKRFFTFEILKFASKYFCYIEILKMAPKQFLNFKIQKKNVFEIFILLLKLCKIASNCFYTNKILKIRMTEFLKVFSLTKAQWWRKRGAMTLPLF